MKAHSSNAPEPNLNSDKSKDVSNLETGRLENHIGRVNTITLYSRTIKVLSLILLILLSAFKLSELLDYTRFSQLNPENTTRHYYKSNLTDVIKWDKYSLIVRDQRVFIFGGEFHPFRLPVPDLWLDVLQKIKATGMNTVSVYLHWGVSNPAPNVVDLKDWRAIQPLLDAAKLAGLFVILRPGPYINAETTAGGIPHWVTSRVSGGLRTNSTDFKNAWEPYLRAVAEVIVPNQITNDGPIIAVQLDNEYTQLPLTHAEYFEQLKQFYRSHGIVIPLTYNDRSRGANFINGTGAVDIYGLDSYPQRFDCSHPDDWKLLPIGLYEYHQRVNPGQPFYLPEVQGGSFDGWGPSSPGYDACFDLTNPSFTQVFNHHIWASNAKMMSLYMMYGGTSWGGFPFPGVYTSYDYGAAIKENRELSPKYYELKAQGMFLRSSPDFIKTDWITDSSYDSSLTYSQVDKSEVFVTHLRNPDTRSSFYIARPANLSSREDVSFKLRSQTSLGDLSIPQTIKGIALAARESRVLVTDYRFGVHSKLLYSTASVFFAGVIGGQDVLFLHGRSDQNHEAGIFFTGSNMVDGLHPHSQIVSTSTNKGYSLVTFLSGISGVITIWDSPTQLVLYADSETAASFYAPLIVRPSNDTLSSYWHFGSNETMLIGGPYLVRNATMEDSVLSLRGDLNGSVILTVIGPPDIRGISWNGMPIANDLQAHSGVFTVPLSPRTRSQARNIPSKLTNWKYRNSLPEIETAFSDADWITADHTSTNITAKPHYRDGRILYGCDYGFCENLVLYRGHFLGNDNVTSVNLVINGGATFAASIWLNGHFLKSVHGSSNNNAYPIGEIETIAHFTEDSLNDGMDNVLTIIMDNMGLEEHGIGDGDDAERSPRGIRGFRLNNGAFTEWKVQGKVGGYSRYPDKVRGVLNEGGSYAERAGWHLPGFDTSEWETRSLYDDSSHPGLGFYVTTFDLDIDEGLDVPMSFVFDKGTFGQAYRGYIFVNGWFMGKRVGKIGPQSKFPVHEGILNYHGTNTFAVLIWTLETNMTVRPDVELIEDGFYDGGVGFIGLNNPPWDASRLRY